MGRGEHRSPPQRCKGPPPAVVARLHDSLRDTADGALPTLSAALAALGEGRTGITEPSFLHSRESWEFLCAMYRSRCADPSFVDYFWTVRTMHAPIFRLSDIARRLPPTRAVHAVSTGYAGLLGAILAARRRIPFVLTEHGIYTKERRIDLAQATWIKDPEGIQDDDGGRETSYLRELWIRFFEQLGRAAYRHANPIISLYEGNRQRQIEDGAAPARTQVIANGIALERFAALAAERPSTIPPVIALIGRVVPIKDILGFVRAMRIVCSQRTEVQGWVVGPDDENRDYADECRRLVTTLGLDQHVRFTGRKLLEEVLPHVGLTVLTSISEALPLAVLESLAAGVPVVATDVGACRELLEGRDAEDCSLGRAGLLVPIADPEAMAQTALGLLGDRERWLDMQRAGQQRVRTYYSRETMFARYRATYRSLLEDSRGRHRV
jgi:glycosyltransferase involved in cell wall biosynthesis